MDKLTLVKTSIDYENQIWEYRSEFLESGEHLAGCAGLESATSVEEWLELLQNMSSEETVPCNFVPATSYLAIRESDDRVVGMLQIRHRLNDYLEALGGHIGYSVRNFERQKGYAKEMLRLGIEEAQNLGIDKILITCHDDNPASEKTILANGGIFDSAIPHGEKLMKRYWIHGVS